MFTSTLVIIGAALVLLVLALLARASRKPAEGPSDDGIAMVRPSTELAPPPTIDEPLPEPGAPSAGLAAELRPAETPAGSSDPLTRMKGLGPKAETTLNGLGITRYDQIAAWTEADISRIDTQMGPFKGRIARDRWVEQAGYLAAGNTTGFEAVFGKLG